MKKIIFTLLICTATMAANATDMCARDDVMVLAFDPMVNATSTGSYAPEWSWWVQFPYGRIAGEATCLSAAEALGRTSGFGAYYGTGEYSSTFITVESGLSGVDADGAERKYCWCKMTHPAVSRWVFGAYSGLSNCATACPAACSGRIQTDRLHKYIFETIGM
ncbi:MAG: hypothetical protein IKW67_03625 [Alphaproteobacteria bacterium]|nr:hypothetical protein [Alphaproteobacteria bacterium]